MNELVSRGLWRKLLNTMEKLSQELLFYCYVNNVTAKRQCQPEWKQMDISVTQASNGFIQSK